MAGAFWISPRGEIVKIGVTHIDAVIKNPEKFGYTDDSIRALYAKHNEPLGVEGKAREEIIKSLIDKGWIRARRYFNNWSITVSKVTKRVKDLLFDFASKLISSGIQGEKEQDKYVDVHIEPIGGGSSIRQFSLQDIANDALFQFESQQRKRAVLTIVESFDLLPLLKKIRGTDDVHGLLESELSLVESSEFKKLKKNETPLTPEERRECLAKKAVWHFNGGGPSPAVWKSVDDGGVTTYVTNTHRAYNTAPTLKGAISRFHKFIKSTA